MVKITKKSIEDYLTKEVYKFKTQLCEISTRFGSDKGSRHNYTTFYNYIFNDIRENVNSIFEVGLGTNNTNVPSNMGPGGHPGASLRTWREYFVNSQVYGADVDKGCLFNEDRIQTFYVDQTNIETINQLWDFHFENQFFDVILDDGLHEFEANRNFFEHSIHKLKSGGIYIIEDIDLGYLQEMENWFYQLSQTGDYELSELITLPIEWDTPIQHQSGIQSNNRIGLIIKT